MRAKFTPCAKCAALDEVRHQKRQDPQNRATPDDEYLRVSLRGCDDERYQLVYQARLRADSTFDEELSIIPYDEGNAMKMFPNAKYVRWILINLDNLRPLLEIPETLRNVSSIQERWFILREAADLVFELLMIFPLPEVASDLPEGILRCEAEQLDADWDKLNALLPIVMTLMELTAVKPD